MLSVLSWLFGCVFVVVFIVILVHDRGDRLQPFGVDSKFGLRLLTDVFTLQQRGSVSGHGKAAAACAFLNFYLTRVPYGP